MTDPVISPDGRWIYTGDKWIEIKDIHEYDFLEGDLKIIEYISSNDFKY